MTFLENILVETNNIKVIVCNHLWDRLHEHGEVKTSMKTCKTPLQVVVSSISGSTDNCVGKVTQRLEQNLR